LQKKAGYNVQEIREGKELPEARQRKYLTKFFYLIYFVKNGTESVIIVTMAE